MKAYLIDPDRREVVEVSMPEERADETAFLHSIYEQLNCRAIEAINPVQSKGDIVYLDEEGKFHPGGLWFCRLWPYETLTGRGLWIGVDGAGGNAGARCTLAYVQDHIVWGLPPLKE